MILKKKILTGIVIGLSLILVFSVLKNIGFPLLWNDEGETAMFGQRILQYGYPKVHDGKNTVYLQPASRIEGVSKKSDAYIVTVWGHFYWAAFGELLARTTDNVYVRTAILRTTFVLAGLLGLALFALGGLSLFRVQKNCAGPFLIGFLVFEILSVALALHLREVRHSSLVIFFSGLIFFIYSQRIFFSKPRFRVYFFAMLGAFFLLYNTFLPAFLAALLTISLAELFRFIKKRNLKEVLGNLAPILFSLVLVFPIYILFKTTSISRALSELNGVTAFRRLDYLMGIFSFFKYYDFLYAMLAARFTVLAWGAARGFFSNFHLAPNSREENSEWPELYRRFQTANFLFLFGIILIIILIAMPLRFIYERYYILLQPVLTVIFLLDFFTIYSLIRLTWSGQKARILKITLVAVLILSGSVNWAYKYNLVKYRLYELFHRYQGPVDFAVLYIRAHYKNPENLIIATNYEECSYMYYLGSKVIFGQFPRNNKEDRKIIPDIIISRKLWPDAISPVTYQPVLYKKITFPVADCPFNNMPEIAVDYTFHKIPGVVGPIPVHLFKTPLAQNENEALVMYCRIDSKK